MFFSKRATNRRRQVLGALLGGGLMFGGFVGTCDDRLIGLTRFFDPCGTVLANCLPGELTAQQADNGDPCFLCAIQGTCGNEDPFLNICN